jgi:hypothetical protein
MVKGSGAGRYVPCGRVEPVVKVHYVFPASCAAPLGTSTINIRSSGDSSNTVWFAPAGTASFVEGATMTKAAGDATSIAVPATAGTYKLFVVDLQGSVLGGSAALLRVSG